MSAKTQSGIYFLFDIGGTNMRFAISRDGKTLAGDPIKEKTPETFKDGIARIREIATELCGREEITVAAGGIAGPLSEEKDMLLQSPNNTDWAGKPFVSELSAALKAPVYIDNDAAVVALGEAHFGAGKDAAIVAYMTVSTGVGGARIVNGEIDVSRYGFEPGHQIIDADNTLCKQCGTVRDAGILDLEGYISGTATERRFGKPPYEITDLEIWDQIARWTAAGVANSIMHWSPDVFVLGGSMVVKRPGIAVADVTKHVPEFLTIFSDYPDIVEATCGHYGGIYGALALAQQRNTA